MQTGLSWKRRSTTYPSLWLCALQYLDEWRSPHG